MHPENNGPLATSTSNTDWDAGAWDGMSEEEALEWDLIEVLVIPPKNHRTQK